MHLIWIFDKCFERKFPIHTPVPGKTAGAASAIINHSSGAPITFKHSRVHKLFTTRIPSRLPPSPRRARFGMHQPETRFSRWCQLPNACNDDDGPTGKWTRGGAFFSHSAKLFRIDLCKRSHKLCIMLSKWKYDRSCLCLCVVGVLAWPRINVFREVENFGNLEMFQN